MNTRNEYGTHEPGLAVLLLYIYSFWGFVVAQPIYSDLFNDGGFFRWYQNTLWDIGIALLVISFLFPGLIILLLWLLSRLFPVVASKLCQVLIIFLLGGFCLLFLRDLPDMPYLLKVTIGLICGAWLTQVLLRSKERKFLLNFFMAGALIFPFWFWIACPLTSPFPTKPSVTSASNRAASHPNMPIVMIIFDELPLTSLLDKNGQIDAVHFPNFAALARSATWYPNAVTVHSITRGAVPAILTGQYPAAYLQWSSVLSGQYKYTCSNPVPTTRTFPDTLFTLLANYYTMQVYESRIYLCNAPSCQQHRLIQDNHQRVMYMFGRIAEEYFFRILFNSKDLYKFDPSLIQSSLESGEAPQPVESPISHEYDISLFHQLLKAIRQPGKNVEKPILYFIHPILPHSPWEYDSSGKRYPFLNSSNSSNDILCKESPSLLYCKNSSFPNELYKRHLLQVGYVDTMLGQIISKLKATQLYDHSLIIIVADHGISFMPHQSRRQISANNYADIMSIPLFIKKPGQIIGKIDERQAETVDIIPTIAEIVHLPLAWHTDGRDLFMSLPADRTSHSICSPKIKMNFSAKQIQAARRKALQKKFTVLHL